MNTKKITAGIVGLAAASAVALGAVGTGTASATTPPAGSYTLEIYSSPTLPSLAHVPASVHDGALFVAGQRFGLTPTAEGARTTVAGQRVDLLRVDGDADGAYIIQVGTSSSGQLLPR
ncbi:hypothetical protein [Gordonia sp. 852002-51296_SCH5728562-b]|uniref:hypothetical protein n=1 Tax=Gordonia sp. 852002-51296_SCH5728562-b TaxID=1834101 RepID=UPI0007EB8FF5|nr:hypothetical protein [Gordonia sp. 852002-51296_SCH5728562-b]OBA39000.1 hypothetical protein A5766_04400 [Gordonia sp. 852002-51296_SCH5728562-b]